MTQSAYANKNVWKNRLMAEILYGSGLRLMELACMRIKDIDFDANTITIRSGKGDKDRTTIFSQTPLFDGGVS